MQEELPIDYEIGLARLADPEDLARSITFERSFEFSEQCLYRALRAGSTQVSAIDSFRDQSDLDVYYQLYNPWTIPFTQHVPLSSIVPLPTGEGIGSRIVPASEVHKTLSKETIGKSPSIGTLLAMADGVPTIGWSLSQFVADLFLGCKQGNRFDGLSDERIQRLFYRRSGPIAAAIAITIEES